MKKMIDGLEMILNLYTTPLYNLIGATTPVGVPIYTVVQPVGEHR